MDVKLKAVKGLTYNTRRLLPGDVFEARPRDARVLLATRKVQAVREPVDLAPPPPAVAEKIAKAAASVRKPTTLIDEPYAGESPPPSQEPALQTASAVGAMTTEQMPNAAAPESDLAAARTEYERVSGKKAFNGWDVATLQAKTAAVAKPA